MEYIDDSYKIETLLSKEIRKYIIPINIKLIIKGEAIADLYSYKPSMSIKTDSNSRLYIPHNFTINRDDLIKGGIYNKQDVSELEKQKVTDTDLIRLFINPEKLIRVSDFSSFRKNKNKKINYDDPEEVKKQEKEKQIQKEKNICNNIKLLTDLLFSVGFFQKKKITIQGSQYTIFKSSIIDPTTKKNETKYNIKQNLKFLMSIQNYLEEIL